MLRVRSNAAKQFNGKAWMLKNDGTAVTVSVHVYGEMGSPDANMEVAVFLSKWAPSDEVINFINLYLANLLIDNYRELLNATADEINEELAKQLMNLGFNLGSSLGLTKQQTVNYILQFKDASYFQDGESVFDFQESQVDQTGNNLYRDLNQQFIRVRAGGRYDSDGSDGNYYFRIGSRGFNWADTIYVFLADNRAQAKYVTIERDNESDADDAGERSGYMVYKNRRGEPYENYPVADFLEEEKTPLLASRQADELGLTAWVKDRLEKGQSYSQLMTLQANRTRIKKAYRSVLNGNLKELSKKSEPMLGIWWYVDGQFWGTNCEFDKGTEKAGYIYPSVNYFEGHAQSWSREVKKHIKDNKLAEEVISKGFRSQERGRVMFNLRLGVFEVTCSKELVNDTEFKTRLREYFNLKEQRVRFEAYDHYGICCLTGNSFADSNYYDI